MYLKRYPVPLGKKIVIGHDSNNGCDVIGFVEPSDTKLVKLADSLYEDYAKTTCNQCSLFFQHYVQKDKYRETYKNLFLAHPDMCVEILNEIGLLHLSNWFYSWQITENVWYNYAKHGLLTAEYFVNGLLKWKMYESFVHTFVHMSVFDDILNKTTSYIYNQYDKCKGFIPEGSCKKDLDIFQAKKISCIHNSLLFLQSLDDCEPYYIYDSYNEAPLSLPNIYKDAEVCWGNNSRPKNLAEAYITWWSTPFNGDLLRDSDSYVSELIDGYGFDSCDFYPYDEYNGTDYDAEPRPFTTDEIITIIKRGGDNPYKGNMNLQHVEFDIKGVREVLIVEDGRKIPDFAEIVYDNFLRDLNDSVHLFIFLINEIEEDVWEAYLPTDDDVGEYIQINLQDLYELDLDEETVNDDD